MAWMTPGASSSPFFRASTFSLKMARRASIWRLTLRSMSLILLVPLLVGLDLDLAEVVAVQLVQDALGQLLALGQTVAPTFEFLVQDGALEQGLGLAPLLALQDGDLVLEVALHAGDLFLLDDAWPGRPSPRRGG